MTEKESNKVILSASKDNFLVWEEGLLAHGLHKGFIKTNEKGTLIFPDEHKLAALTWILSNIDEDMRKELLHHPTASEKYAELVKRFRGKSATSLLVAVRDLTSHRFESFSVEDMRTSFTKLRAINRSIKDALQSDSISVDTLSLVCVLASLPERFNGVRVALQQKKSTFDEAESLILDEAKQHDVQESAAHYAKGGQAPNRGGRDQTQTCTHGYGKSCYTCHPHLRSENRKCVDCGAVGHSSKTYHSCKHFDGRNKKNKQKAPAEEGNMAIDEIAAGSVFMALDPQPQFIRDETDLEPRRVLRPTPEGGYIDSLYYPANAVAKIMERHGHVTTYIPTPAEPMPTFSQLWHKLDHSSRRTLIQTADDGYVESIYYSPSETACILAGSLDPEPLTAICGLDLALMTDAPVTLGTSSPLFYSDNGRHSNPGRIECAYLGEGVMEDLTFVIDSGATSHMCRNRASFQNYLSVNSFISTANGGKSPCLGRGSLDEIELKGVLHCPILTHNLLSVRALVERGLQVLFDNHSCSIVHPLSNRILVKGVRRGNLFICHLNRTFTLESANMVQKYRTCDRTILAHRRMGHLNYRSLRLLTHMSTGLNLDKEPQDMCIACASTKICRGPFPESDDHASAIGDLVLC